jgi:hypothetical protein
MNRTDGFERAVATWLGEEAGLGAPAYLDEVLARTARSRQRPAWSSLERWLPMDTTLRLVPVPRVAWLLGIVAILLALVVAAVLVGSQPRLPAPFGPARNGVLAYASVDGDIYALDPTTRASTLVIGGPARDIAPTYSPAGTRFAFGRQGESANLWQVMVADADGSSVRALAPPRAITGWAWSPDGSSIAISDADAPGFSILYLDGRPPLAVDLGMAVESLQWRPGGRDLVSGGSQARATDPTRTDCTWWVPTGPGPARSFQ